MDLQKYPLTIKHSSQSMQKYEKKSSPFESVSNAYKIIHK
jgi:hypothetical protein